MHCQKCSLCKNSLVNNLAVSNVLGCGNPKAEIMLVGDTVGTPELEQKRPFLGPPGQLLRKYMASVGLSEINVYLDTLIKCKPLFNKPPTKSEINKCGESLDLKIKEIKPKVIGMLGNLPTQFLTGKTGVNSLRGSKIWSEKYNCWLVPMFHPAFLLRFTNRARQHTEFIQDLSLLKKLVDETFIEENTKILVVQSIEEVRKVIDILLKQEVVAFDLETTGLDCMNSEILCHSFSYKEGTGIFIPYKDDRFFSYNQLDLVKKELQRFYSSNVKKIAQNGKFDVKFLLTNGIEINNFYFDTYIAHYLLNEEGDHSLANLSLLFTKKQNYKDFLRAYIKGDFKIETKEVDKKGKQIKRDSTILDAPIQEYIKYAVEDSDVTLQVYNKISILLEQEGLTNLFFKIIMPAVMVLAKMEVLGINGDLKHIKSTEFIFQKKIWDLSLKLQENIKVKEFCKVNNLPELNFNSPKQLQEFFFNFLNYFSVKTTPKGLPSVDKESLELLYKKNKSKILFDLLEYRKLQKFYSTYVVDLKTLLEHSKDQRIRTTYNITGTVTGRLSSAEPNLQNQPKHDEYAKYIRRTFIAKEGYTLIEADYKQLEFRVFAHASGDEKLIKIAKETDIHRTIASKIFNIPIEAITKEQRFLAKTAVFGGIMYGGGPSVICRESGLSFPEAQRIIQDFFCEFTVADSYITNTINFGKENGYVVNLFGRKRRLGNGFFSKDEFSIKEAERQAINSPIQSSASDIVLIAMKKLSENLKNYDINLLLNIHDAIIFECKDDSLEQCLTIIKESMEKAVPLKVPLAITIETGKNLSEMTEKI